MLADREQIRLGDDAMLQGRFVPLHSRSLLLPVAVLAWICVVFGALVRPQEARLLWAGLGAMGLTLAAIWPRRAKADAKVLACRFCAKTQQEVHKLVAGPDDLYICDECVRLSADIIDDLPSELDRVARHLQASLWKLIPSDHAVRVVDAWLALSAAQFARAGGNFSAALHALQAVPSDRAANRLEDASVRLVELEEPITLDRLLAIDREQLEEGERAHLQALIAYAQFTSGPATDRASHAAAARAAVEGLTTPSWSGSVAEALSAALEVRLALARSAFDQAHELARSATERHDMPLLWELLAQVHDARGQIDATHEARRRGSARCEPTSARGRRLAAELGAPYR